MKFRFPRYSNIHLFGFLAAAYLLFIPVAHLVERQDFFEAMNAVICALGAGVSFGYLAGFWRAVRLPPHKMDAADLAIVAIFLSSIAGIQIFAGQWAWRAFGRPDWIIDSMFLAFTRWQLAVAMTLLLMTNFSREGKLIIGGTWRTLALVGVALLVAAVLIFIGYGPTPPHVPEAVRVLISV